MPEGVEKWVRGTSGGGGGAKEGGAPSERSMRSSPRRARGLAVRLGRGVAFDFFLVPFFIGIPSGRGAPAPAPRSPRRARSPALHARRRHGGRAARSASSSPPPPPPPGPRSPRRPA